MQTFVSIGLTTGNFANREGRLIRTRRRLVVLNGPGCYNKCEANDLHGLYFIHAAKTIWSSYQLPSRWCQTNAENEEEKELAVGNGPPLWITIEYVLDVIQLMSQLAFTSTAMWGVMWRGGEHDVQLQTKVNIGSLCLAIDNTPLHTVCYYVTRQGRAFVRFYGSARQRRRSVVLPGMLRMCTDPLPTVPLNANRVVLYLQKFHLYQPPEASVTAMVLCHIDTRRGPKTAI